MATLPTNTGIGTLPPELFAQQQALNRQQQMAQLLMQQGQQMPSGQMVSGRYVAPSFFQYASPLFQTYAATKLQEKGDKQATELAQALRKRYGQEIEQYQDLLRGKEATYAPDIPTETYETVKGKMTSPAVPANPQAAYLFGSTAYNPALQQLALKKLTEGPKWEKAELDMPDGSVRKGWVDYNSPNPRATFVEGGTKPAFTSLEAARFTYETGMAPPSGVSPTGARPTTGGAVPTGGAIPTGNQPVSNQPSMTQASYTGGMSPQARNEANKQLFVEDQKARQEALRNLPTDLNRAEQAILTVDQMLGGAMPNEKASFGWETPKGKSEPHAGFNAFVGGTWRPFARFVEGSDPASFQVLYDSLKGQAFLEAFQRLKGAGAITEVEGEKATTALLKLNKAQSEADFVKYAREFQDNLRKGMELAKQKAGAPNSVGVRPTLRWNPQTNSWVENK
jgi:hypothetical protein